MPSVSSRGRGRRTINEINMVPFIDVMLVLLIIFMVTAPLITPGSIDVPSAGQASAKPPEGALTVQIDEAGQFSLLDSRGRTLATDGRTEADIIAAVRAQLETNPGLPVMIAGDRTLQYQNVVTTITQLRDAGVGRVGLAVR